MKKPELLDRALHLLSQVAEAHTTAAIAVAELRALLFEQSSKLNPNSHQSMHAKERCATRPIVDQSTFRVAWNGHSCRLGNRLSLKLLDRLCRRPDQYVSHEQLLNEVWRARRSP